MSKDITIESICGEDAPAARPRKIPPRNGCKKPGDLGEATRRARELYLYGDGDGKPVRNAIRLAEMSGAATKTISTHLPAWRSESVALATAHSTGNRELGEKVTVEAIAWQARGVELLKLECERLEKVLPGLPAGSELHAAALKLYSATLKTWAEQSGFAAFADCQAVMAREMVKLAARAKGKEQEEKPREATGFDFTLADSKEG